jgi:hypothetical protein
MIKHMSNFLQSNEKEILHEFNQYEYKENLLIYNQFFSIDGILQNLFRIPVDKSIFYLLQDKQNIQHLKTYIDMYEQEILHLFSFKINKQQLEQLPKTCMQLSRKKELPMENNCTCKCKTKMFDI